MRVCNPGQGVLMALPRNRKEDMLPLEHLSASSLNKFQRCPRQWQRSYIHGLRDPSSSPLVIGSAVHNYLAQKFDGSNRDFDTVWLQTVQDAGTGIDWKDEPAKARQIAAAHADAYWEYVGKHLKVIKAEQEISVDIPGVPIPVVGFVDAETEDRIIDFKTTKYMNPKAVRVNKEWKFQMGIYQIALGKPAEVHVLTRAKAQPVLIPENTSSPLYFGLQDTEKIAGMVRDIWGMINYCWETYGAEKPWPGNPMHEWAGRYCSVENCCAL